MIRFQAALKSYLNRQIEKLRLELQELVRTCPTSHSAVLPPASPWPSFSLWCRAWPPSKAESNGRSWGWTFMGSSSTWPACRCSLRKVTTATPLLQARGSRRRRSCRGCACSTPRPVRPPMRSTKSVRLLHVLAGVHCGCPHMPQRPQGDPHLPSNPWIPLQPGGVAQVPLWPQGVSPCAVMTPSHCGTSWKARCVHVLKAFPTF